MSLISVLFLLITDITGNHYQKERREKKERMVTCRNIYYDGGVDLGCISCNIAVN